MKNEQASARTADAVQFMQLRVAAKDVVQLVEYMLQHGEWYLAEERIERLRNALEGSVCPACGSDRNERDELDKAEREIERLRSAPATLQQAEPVAWRDPSNKSPRQAVTFSKADRDEWPHIYKEPLYLHPPAAPQQAGQFDHLAGRGMHELRFDELTPYVLSLLAGKGQDTPDVRIALDWIVSELKRKTNDERALAVKLDAIRAAPRAGRGRVMDGAKNGYQATPNAEVSR